MKTTSPARDDDDDDDHRRRRRARTFFYYDDAYDAGDHHQDVDRYCRVSNSVSYCGALTRSDASCLMRCHLAFVSYSRHFLRTPLSLPWRHIQSLRDADTNPRKVPSRDGYPRRSSRIVQRRWEMKDPAAQRI